MGYSPPQWGKNSVIKTLLHRAKTVFSTAEHHRTEVKDMKEVLTPMWALEWMECENFHQGRPNKDSNKTPTQTTTTTTKQKDT